MFVLPCRELLWDPQPGGEGRLGVAVEVEVGAPRGSLEVPSFTLPPQIVFMCVYASVCVCVCPPSVPE